MKINIPKDMVELLLGLSDNELGATMREVVSYVNGSVHTHHTPLTEALKKKQNKPVSLKHIQAPIEDRIATFAKSISEYKNQYPREMLYEFYKYWTEPNKSKTRFRQEMEETWDLGRRLETWAKRDRVFSKDDAPKQHITKKLF